jgi:hypothetical protein
MPSLTLKFAKQNAGTWSKHEKKFRPTFTKSNFLLTRCDQKSKNRLF